MKVGFLGLGAMGRHMAASLGRGGYALQSYDLKGGGNRKSAREAMAGAEILFTSLPGPKEVEALSKELNLPKGAAWFDLSTNSPSVVRKIHRELKGIEFLDAPVSGGPTGAESGRLAIWVGGDRQTYEKYLPVLKAIGDQPYYVGPIGAGTVAKLSHNLASFTVQAALAEIFTLGVKGGVEPLALYKALRQGASGRRRLFDRLADFFLPGKYDPPSFTLRLAQKDVALALEMGRELGVPLKIGGVALEELEEGMRRGWAERDCRVAMTLQEERAGVKVHVPAERLREVTD